MRLFISDFKAAQHFKPSRPWAIISISTRPRDFVPLEEENRIGVLQLAFADIDHDDIDIHETSEEREAKKEFMLPFTEEHADLILRFMSAMQKQGAEMLLVHCEAGVSRSPGVGAALCELSECSRSLTALHTLYHPNVSVKSRILKRAKELGVSFPGLVQYSGRYLRDNVNIPSFDLGMVSDKNFTF